MKTTNKESRFDKVITIISKWLFDYKNPVFRNQ